MNEIVTTAMAVEKMGVLGILAALNVVQALVIRNLWLSIADCHRNQVKLAQGDKV